MPVMANPSCSTPGVRALLFGLGRLTSVLSLWSRYAPKAKLTRLLRPIKARARRTRRSQGSTAEGCGFSFGHLPRHRPARTLRRKMATTPSSSRRDPSESSAANSDSVTTPRDIPPVVPKLDGLEPKWHDGPSSTKLTTCLLQHFVFSLYKNHSQSWLWLVWFVALL